MQGALHVQMCHRARKVGSQSGLHSSISEEAEQKTTDAKTDKERMSKTQQAEHALNVQLQKRLHTDSLPDYVPSTKLWPRGSKTVSQKQAGRRQTGKRIKTTDGQPCETEAGK